MKDSDICAAKTPSTPTRRIADGPTLSGLIAVNKAYSVTDAASMCGRMFRAARWPSRLAVLVSITATFVAVSCHSDPGCQIAAVALVSSFFWFKRDAFRDYYGKKCTATFLDTFTRREQAIRYVMFRENIPDEIATDSDLLERLRAVLEQRQKVRQAGLVTRHPLVTTLIALFLMFLGVIISKVADASSITGTLTMTFFVGMLIILAMQFGSVWRSREYRDEELAEFVLWLWAEATDQQLEGSSLDSRPRA